MQMKYILLRIGKPALNFNAFPEKIGQQPVSASEARCPAFFTRKVTFYRILLYYN